MAKVTFRKVNENAWINKTFLQNYSNSIVRVIEYKNGRIDIKTDSGTISHCEGNFTSEYNGWSYTLKKLLGRPIKKTI